MSDQVPGDSPSGDQPNAGPPGMPGQPAYGQPGQVPPGYPQPPVVVVEQKSKTGLIIGIIVAVLFLLCLMPTIAILAVTFLGKSASSKFSSVGSAVRDISIHADYLAPYVTR